MYDSSDLEVKTVTISAGGSLSAALDKRYFTYMAILLPSTWTTASITFAGIIFSPSFLSHYQKI
ncbi:unnamed protein product [marine sediment metagenome]|uniref:Uncharacterized protein n=1 Tax=marine sediment metagenome TaxID=412755 RepID=X1ANQ7_9ZZZZ